MNSDHSRFWKWGHSVNPSLPLSFPLLTSVAQTSQEPAQLRRHHQPLQPQMTYRDLSSQHTSSNQVPRLTSLLLHLWTDGEIANCCNHYVRLWRFLKKKSISGYFSNEIKPLYGKDICYFPIFIVAYLQQPGNGNSLTVHWGMNG